MPVPTPKMTKTNALPTESERVVGKRSTMVPKTGSRLMNEYPRQGAGQCPYDWYSRPTKTPCSQCQYCTGIESAIPRL